MQEKNAASEKLQQQNSDDDGRIHHDGAAAVYTKRSRCGRDLPPDVIRLILRRLHLPEAARSQLVSRDWRCAWRAMSSTPWLLLLRHYGKHSETCYLMITSTTAELVDDGACYLPFEMKLPPEIRRCSFRGSRGAWLILRDEESGRLSLFNPFSRARILLPPLVGGGGLVCLSAAPTSPDCAVIVMNMWLDGRKLVHVWRMGDVAWRTLEVPDWPHVLPGMFCRTVKVAPFQGRLYTMDRRAARRPMKAIDLLSPTPTRVEVPDFPSRTWYYRRVCFVESDGQLLLVCGVMTGVPRVEVYRLDLSRWAWVKMESLGKDRAVFLGGSRLDSYSISVSVMRAECKGDCIYYLSSPFSDRRHASSGNSVSTGAEGRTVEPLLVLKRFDITAKECTRLRDLPGTLPCGDVVWLSRP